MNFKCTKLIYSVFPRAKEDLADDLEEGEIEDDDEQPVEEKPLSSVPNKDQNETGSKEDTVRPQTDVPDSKLISGDKQRDKRQTSNNLSGGNSNVGRSKRRAGSHESSGRESQVIWLLNDKPVSKTNELLALKIREKEEKRTKMIRINRAKALDR